MEGKGFRATHSAVMVSIAVAWLVTGCGGGGGGRVDTGSAVREPSTVAAHQTSRTSQSSMASPTATGAGAVQKFAAALADTPAWATVRRAGPTSVGDLVSASEGVVIGRLKQVHDVVIEEVSTEDVVGVVEGVEAAPLDRVDVQLTLALESASGPLAAAVGSAQHAQVPLTVWLSGTRSDIGAVADELAASLRDSAPLGTRMAVYTSGIEDLGDGSIRLAVPTFGGLTDPAAVVFETEPGGLVSLDWLVGDEAESYYGVDSLATLAAASTR